MTTHPFARIQRLIYTLKNAYWLRRDGRRADKVEALHDAISKRTDRWVGTKADACSLRFVEESEDVRRRLKFAENCFRGQAAVGCSSTYYRKAKGDALAFLRATNASVANKKPQ